MDRSRFSYSELRSVPQDNRLPALFEGEGLLSGILSGFEARPGQITMAAAVDEVFTSGGTLIAEAGTGIGKSLAYLVPATLWALSSDEPVIVSTFTRALQEQLLTKDIPVVLRLLQECGAKRQPTIVALKGRSNYVCRERWLAESRRRNPDPELAMLVARLRPWMQYTTTGDKAELALTESEDRTFGRMSASSENCSWQTCGAKHSNLCFFARARAAAQRADLVVVNHALLFSDQGAGGALLPESTRLVIDEAHHLEAAATRQFSSRLTTQVLTFLVGQLVELKADTVGGLLPVAVGIMASNGVFAESETDAAAALQRVRTSLHNAGAAISDTVALFQRLATVLDVLDDAHPAATAARIRDSSRTLPAWSSIEQVAENALEALNHLQGDADWLQRQLGKAARNSQIREQIEPMQASVAAWQESFLEFMNHLGEIILLPGPNGVYWIDAANGLDNLAICSAPLDAGAQISDTIYAEKESIVLTSATMATNGSFAHFRRQTGVADSIELSVPSPFDYQSASLVLLANDVPEPSHRDYDDAISDAVIRLATALGGRSLVLFTSIRHLRSTAETIRPVLQSRGIAVHAQWVDGTPEALAERLRSDESCVALGAASMWEGIDVPGPGLSALVVVRLPFDVPSDPLFRARSEQSESPFLEYAVPRAVLRFRQGFGRLIRSSTDRGVFVVLDRRIMTKAYGRSFLNAIPACERRNVPVRELGTAASDWLERAGQHRY